MPLEKVIDQHEVLPIFSSRPVDSSKKEIARHKKNLSEINLKVLKNTSSLVSETPDNNNLNEQPLVQI